MTQTQVEGAHQAMVQPPVQSVASDLEQRTFRALLQVMSRPGTIEQLPQGRVADGPWAGALLVMQCLLDHEVTFCVQAADTALHEQILRRTGARSASLAEAGFVLCDAAGAVEALTGAREGDLEEPERSATVVVRVDAVGVGALHMTLRGPGIESAASLQIAGLDAAALRTLVERNATFPTGIEVVLVDLEGRVACLPRSTRITLED